MALIKCPNCETSISDKAHRCPKCGYVLKPSDRSNSLTETTSCKHNDITPTDIPQYERGSPRRSYYWLWYLGGGLILIGLVLWLFSPKKASSTQGATIINEETPVEAATEERVMTEEEICNADTTHVIEAESEAAAADFDGVSSQHGTYTLTGKVNDKYAVKVWLTIEGNSLSGKYSYVSTLEKYGDQPSSYIQIQGNITSSNEFKFTTTNINSSNKSEWEGDFNGNCFYAKKTGNEETMVAYVDE